MRRQSILKGLRCRYCCSLGQLPLQHIGNHELLGQQRRQLSSSSNGIDAPDHNASNKKPRPASSGFGRGWSAPAFDAAMTITAAELKQREALLAQPPQQQSPPPSRSANENGATTGNQQSVWICTQCQMVNRMRYVVCAGCKWKPSKEYLSSRESQPPQRGNARRIRYGSEDSLYTGKFNRGADSRWGKTSDSEPLSDHLGNRRATSRVGQSWSGQQHAFKRGEDRQSSLNPNLGSRAPQFDDSGLTSTAKVSPFMNSRGAWGTSRFKSPSAQQSDPSLDSRKASLDGFSGSSSVAEASRTNPQESWKTSGYRSIFKQQPGFSPDSRSRASSAKDSWELSGFRSVPQQLELERPAEGSVSKSKPEWDAIDVDVKTDKVSTTPASSKRGYGNSSNFTRYEEEDADVSSKPRKRKGFESRSKRQSSNYDEDAESMELEEEHGAGRRKRKEDKKREKQLLRQQAGPTPIVLPDFISVGNLADVINVRRPKFIKSLQRLGFDDVTNDHVLDSETAGLIVTEFNFEPVVESDGIDLVAAPAPEDTSNLPSRPPVVTIMGHVDHGKTTLLDYLRKSSVVATEHGGITQHIGAFSVSMPSGKQITFLDTPGHAAFLEMRKRGADVTDIVILVVAADDSVKPQTIEAIKHAKGADVPIIVAINKIDKEDTDIDRVKQDLSRHSVSVEDYGGDVQAIGVSGKTGQGMLELEEAVITLAEMLDLRAEQECNFEGWVIEASTKKGGRAATLLVRQGILRPGNVIVAGTSWAKIRAMRNEAGDQVTEALPGTPVEVDGWKDQPVAGSEALQAPDEQRAKAVVELRLEREETQRQGGDIEAINQTRRQDREKRQLQAEQQNGGASEDIVDKSGPQPIPFIVKADVSGSAEAIVNAISAIGNNEVFAKILRFNVGKVGESDIRLASATNADVISFNQTVDLDVMKLANAEEVSIRNHNIIYELIDDVKARLSEHLPPTITHRVSGEAEIGEIFHIKVKGRKTTAVAGCKVRNGVIHRPHKVRVLRGKQVIYDGALSSLKNVKKDVTEMRKGTECGMAFEDWTDFAVGDEIQTYEIVHEKRSLD
ncbi:hypothetical protein FQN49_003093 [Arthroderma sp. PD_2]|nr:hypothetical protein FQN49_003093 [Arthroderma sp. PD_2]